MLRIAESTIPELRNYFAGLLERILTELANIEDKIADTNQPITGRLSERRSIELRESSLPGGAEEPPPTPPNILVQIFQMFFGTSVMDWATEYDTLFEIIDKLQSSAMEAAFENADSLGLAVDWSISNPSVQLTKNKLGHRISAINNTTKRDVQKVVVQALDEGVTMPELAEKLRVLVEEVYEGRAVTIARTESQVAYNLGSKLAYEQEGLKYVELADNPAHDTPYGAADGLSCAQRNGLIVPLSRSEIHVASEHPNGTLALLPVLDPQIAADFYDDLPDFMRDAVDSQSDRSDALKKLRKMSRAAKEKGNPQPWQMGGFDISSIFPGTLPTKSALPSPHVTKVEVPAAFFQPDFTKPKNLTVAIDQGIKSIDADQFKQQFNQVVNHLEIKDPIYAQVINAGSMPWKGLYTPGGALGIDIRLNAWQLPKGDPKEALKTIYHEFGHHLHYTTAPSAYTKGKTLSIPIETAAKVSKYATTNDREFVAEVFGRTLAFGTKYDDDVMEHYAKLKGPRIPGVKAFEPPTPSITQTINDPMDLVDKWEADEAKRLSNLDPVYTETLYNYTQESFFEINDRLRREGKLLKWETDVEQLDFLVETSPGLSDKLTLFRGVRESEGLVNKVFSDLKPGDIFEEKGFMSTSASKQISTDFIDYEPPTNKIVFEIEAPAGTKGIWTSSVNEWDQKEYVLGRNTKLQVLDVQKSGLDISVKAKVLPPVSTKQVSTQSFAPYVEGELDDLFSFDMDDPIFGQIAGITTKEHALTTWDSLVLEKKNLNKFSKKKGEKWATKAKAVGLIDAAELKYIKDGFTGTTDELFTHIDNLVKGLNTTTPSVGISSKLPEPKIILSSPPPAHVIAGLTDISQLTYYGPKPGGSASGALYKDAAGTKWLVKEYPQSAQAPNEVLAAKFYEKLGFAVPEMSVITVKGGKLGVASKWIEEPLENINPKQVAQLDEAYKGFATDAWLANWDVVGLGLDNLMVGKNTGKLYRVDPGGALLYRAQGTPKGQLFEDVVGEWETLRTKGSAQKVFANITVEQMEESAKVLNNISDGEITQLVSQFGPGDAVDKAALSEKLIKRKNDILLNKVKSKPEVHMSDDVVEAIVQAAGGPDVKDLINQADQAGYLMPGQKDLLIKKVDAGGREMTVLANMQSLLQVKPSKPVTIIHPDTGLMVFDTKGQSIDALFFAWKIEDAYNGTPDEWSKFVSQAHAYGMLSDQQAQDWIISKPDLWSAGEHFKAHPTYGQGFAGLMTHLDNLKTPAATTTTNISPTTLKMMNEYLDEMMQKGNDLKFHEYVDVAGVLSGDLGVIEYDEAFAFLHAYKDSKAEGIFNLKLKLNNMEGTVKYDPTDYMGLPPDELDELLLDAIGTTPETYTGTFGDLLYESQLKYEQAVQSGDPYEVYQWLEPHLIDSGHLSKSQLDEIAETSDSFDDYVFGIKQVLGPDIVDQPVSKAASSAIPSSGIPNIHAASGLPLLNNNNVTMSANNIGKELGQLLFDFKKKPTVTKPKIDAKIDELIQYGYLDPQVGAKWKLKYPSITAKNNELSKHPTYHDTSLANVQKHLDLKYGSGVASPTISTTRIAPTPSSTSIEWNNYAASWFAGEVTDGEFTATVDELYMVMGGPPNVTSLVDKKDWLDKKFSGALTPTPTPTPTPVSVGLNSIQNTLISDVELMIKNQHDFDWISPGVVAKLNGLEKAGVPEAGGFNSASKVGTIKELINELKTYGTQGSPVSKSPSIPTGILDSIDVYETHFSIEGVDSYPQGFTQFKLDLLTDGMITQAQLDKITLIGANYSDQLNEIKKILGLQGNPVPPPAPVSLGVDLTTPLAKQLPKPTAAGNFFTKAESQKLTTYNWIVHWETSGPSLVGKSKKLAGKHASAAKSAGIFTQAEVNAVKNAATGDEAFKKLDEIFKTKKEKYLKDEGLFSSSTPPSGFKIPPPPSTPAPTPTPGAKTWTKPADSDLADYISLSSPNEFLTIWNSQWQNFTKEQFEAFVYQGWQKGIFSEKNLIYIQTKQLSLHELKKSFHPKVAQKVAAKMTMEQKKILYKDQLDKLKINLKELTSSEVSRPVPTGSVDLPGFFAQPFEITRESYDHAARIAKLEAVKKAQSTSPMNKLKPGVDALTPSQRSAGKSYTGSGYISMNQYARGKSGSVNNNVKILDEAFLNSATATPVDLYASRGINASSQTAELYQHLSEGDIISDAGFISTSVAPNWSWGGTGHGGKKSIKFQILVPKGTHVLGAQHFSSFSSEQEIILPRGSAFLVHRVIETSDVITLQVEVIGGKP